MKELSQSFPEREGPFGKFREKLKNEKIVIFLLLTFMSSTLGKREESIPLKPKEQS